MPYLIALAIVALVILAIFGLAGLGAAAFFKSVILSKGGGGSWSVPSRPRVDKHPTQKKLLFEKTA